MNALWWAVVAQTNSGGPAPAQLPVPAPIAIGLVAIVCVVAAVWIAHHANRIRGREEAVRVSARRLGMTYHGADAKGYGKVRLAIFDDADIVSISHQSSGRTRAGTAVCSFDYASAREVVVQEQQPTIGSFSSTNVHPPRTRQVSTGNVASAAIADVVAFFPHLLVSPQGAIRHAVNNMTGADLKFESTEFNRLFQVTTDNAGFARLFLSPYILDLLVNADGAIGLETFGRSVVLFGDDIAASQLPALAMMVGEVVENLDPIVIREYPPPDLVVPGEFRKPFLA